MLADLLLALLTQSPGAPPTPSPAPIATPPTRLPDEPAAIAGTQFVAFATGQLNASFYTQLPAPEQTEAARKLLVSLGRIKWVTLLHRTDTRYGIAYAYKFQCERGNVIERFTVKNGKIAEISFARA